MKITIGTPLEVNSGRCPCCGARLTGVTPIDCKTGPSAGDASFCLYCAALLIFEPDLSLRPMLPAERETFLDAIVDKVLAYRPKPKTKPARRRKRLATKRAKDEQR